MSYIHLKEINRAMMMHFCIGIIIPEVRNNRIGWKAKEQKITEHRNFIMELRNKS
jgi:hypothetical protein